MNENKNSYKREFSVTIERDAQTDRIIGEVWRNLDGVHDRDGDLPAIIRYDRDTGEEILRAWYFQGEEHRDRGPAFEKIESGHVVSEVWKRHGKMHREGDRPAQTFRSREAGQITFEVYATRGLKDRANGPAVISYDESGNILEQEFWRNGQKVTGTNTPASPPRP